MGKYDKDEARRLKLESEKNAEKTGELLDRENMNQDQLEMLELDWQENRFRSQAHMIGDLFSPPDPVPNAIRGLELRLHTPSECKSCRYTACQHHLAA